MSVLTALYNSYKYCEDNDFVDQSQKIDSETVLLPIYHSNKKSNGNDIIEITLNKNSEVVSVDFLGKEEIIIFPITEDSVGRASGIAPHSLADEISYLSEEEKNKNDVYMNNLKEWIDYSRINNKKSILFLEIIQKFLEKKTFLEEIFKNYYKKNFVSFSNGELKYLDEKQNEKIINMKKVFLTFKIIDLFGNDKDYSVTNYKKLHKDYIDYMIEKEINRKRVCDISGEEIYCSSKHRGLFGTSKLISVSNNDETYYGRLKKGEEIISIGHETSQKIHNMLKYFLENKKNYTFLGENSYLINWFSDDINNSENISVTRDIDNMYAIFDEVSIVEDKKEISELYNTNILKYLSGNYREVGNKEKYYVMIVNKISNGRVAIKYFRELKKSEFYERVSKWYKTISWKGYDYQKKRKVKKYPGIYKIINYTYGIERSGKIEFEQKKYRRDLIENLITTMIDGKRIPLNIVKKMYFNVSNRQRYDKTWSSVVEMACSIFKKYNIDYKNKEVSEDMFDNKDRDFLYGRLLAVFEKMEEATFGDEKRATNAQKLWSSFVNNPGKTMNILVDKLQPYKRKLENSKRGLFIMLEKIIQEITINLMATEDFENNKNKKLNENFIFGYYYQRNEFFKSKDNQDEN
mgnify:CR=1 FL=1